MPWVHRAGTYETLREQNVYEQTPPFWDLVSDHLPQIGIVFLLVGGALAWAARKQRPQRPRASKAFAAASWAFSLLAMLALVAWLLELILLQVKG